MSKYIFGKITKEEIDKVFEEAYDYEKKYNSQIGPGFDIIEIQKLSLLYENYKNRKDRQVKLATN